MNVVFALSLVVLIVLPFFAPFKTFDLAASSNLAFDPTLDDSSKSSTETDCIADFAFILPDPPAVAIALIAHAHFQVQNPPALTVLRL